MRKVIIIAISIIFLSSFVNAQHLKIEAKSGYFSPSETVFKDIYGRGLMYTGEVSISTDIDNLNGIEVWFGTKSFRKTGELTYNKEETKLKILSLGGGAKYRLSFLNRVLYLYVGLGGNYNRFTETNIFGEVRHYEWGYEGQLGVYIKPTKGLLIDLYLDYSYCKMKPEEIEFNIGGIAIGIGLGYEF